MSVCAKCGHVLGIGRFCTNCGHPVGVPAPGPVGHATWRTDTAERPAVPAPPDLTGHLHHAADEQAVTSRDLRSVSPRRRTWPIWLAAAVALALVAVLGAVLLLGGDDSGTVDGPATAVSSAATSPTQPASDPPSPSGSVEPGAAVDVARLATVEVPDTAPPNQDTEGNLVRYDGGNLLDGVPETAWRMPGDGSGETIVITLDGPTSVSSLGLVNGYAKTAGDLDWYDGNRRVLAVVWELDDGTTLSQDLAEDRGLQSIDVPDVPTTTVRLTLVEVSEPGPGPSRRDYTAISEVSVVGVPEA